MERYELAHLNLQTLRPDTLLNAEPHSENIIQRLGLFAAWLSSEGRPWYRPDIPGYAFYLSNHKYRKLSPHSINVYLSAAQSAYREMLSHPQVTRQQILDSIQQCEPNRNATQVLKHALDAIRNAAYDNSVRLQVIRPVSEHLHLTAEQVEGILNQPDVSIGKGIRDAAILSLLFCTGIRDVELVNVTVKDLYHEINGELALHVPNAPKCIKRTIRYRELIWVREVVESWLNYAHIQDGFVFRGLFRNGRPRDTKLSARAIHNILKDYPLLINDEPYTVSMMDIRYTYARLLYLSGVQFDLIRYNLGHTTKSATLNYIGTIDRDPSQLPPALYFNLSKIPSQYRTKPTI